MPFVEANDCRFFYEARGDGPPLLFIHGEGHGPEYFEHQVAEFGRRYRCITYNRRAHGRSEAPTYGYSLHNQARDAVALLDALGVREPVVAVAVAFGTPVAVQLALEWPDRLRGLVLVAWSEIEDVEPYLELFRRQTPGVLEIISREGQSGLREHVLREGQSFTPVWPSAVSHRETYAKWLGDRGPQAWQGRLELVTSVSRLTSRFHEIQVPVLGVEGARDPFPCHPELLAGNPRFRQHYIDDADRFVHWEHPQQFNRLIGGFLAELGH